MKPKTLYPLNDLRERGIIEIKKSYLNKECDIRYANYRDKQLTLIKQSEKEINQTASKITASKISSCFKSVHSVIASIDQFEVGHAFFINLPHRFSSANDKLT